MLDTTLINIKIILTVSSIGEGNRSRDKFHHTK